MGGYPGVYPRVYMPVYTTLYIYTLYTPWVHHPPTLHHAAVLATAAVTHVAVRGGPGLRRRIYPGQRASLSLPGPKGVNVGRELCAELLALARENG